VAQEGGSKTFSQMLSTSAKFGLHLVLAHQTQSQLDVKTKGAIGNVGVKVVFGVDREDAEVMAKKLFAPDLTQVKSEAHTETQHPIFTPVFEQWEKYTQELQGLPSRYAYARSGNGEAKRLKTDTVDDRGCPAEELERIKRYSLKKYGRPVEETTRAIANRYRSPEKIERVRRYEEMVD
jgi:hypothetical protein